MPEAPAATPADPELGLEHYLQVLRRQKRPMIVTVLLVAGCVLAFMLLRPARYTSTAQLLFEPALQEAIFGPDVGSSRDRQNDQIPNELVLLRSNQVREAVKTALEWPADRPSSSLAKSVSIRRIPDTSIVAISATASSPQEAAGIAQTYAETYHKIRLDQTITDLQAASEQARAELDEVRRQLDEVEAPVAALDEQLASALDTSARSRLTDQRDELIRRSEAQRDSLQTRYAELDNQIKQLALAGKVTTTAGIQIVSAAEVPTSPSGLDLKRGMAAALGLGLLFALVVGFLREALGADSGPSDRPPAPNRRPSPGRHSARARGRKSHPGPPAVDKSEAAD